MQSLPKLSPEKLAVVTETQAHTVTLPHSVSLICRDEQLAAAFAREMAADGRTVRRSTLADELHRDVDAPLFIELAALGAWELTELMSHRADGWRRRIIAVSATSGVSSAACEVLGIDGVMRLMRRRPEPVGERRLGPYTRPMKRVA